MFFFLQELPLSYNLQFSMQCVLIFTVTSLSKHYPYKPCKHLHFLSSSDEYDCPPRAKEHVMDPTTEWPQWPNGVHQLNCPSIASF